MVGNFITRIIILLVGYAHPAYGCYKSVEKKKPEIEELRYWCKYWILVGLFTFLERIGDIFVSWLPLYCEIKIALFVYLWYPKSQGISYVYETLLCPYMSKHELDIDQGISTLKIRGHSIIVQLLQCGYLWIHQIFSYLQQRFAIYKINNRAKSKDRQETGTSFFVSPLAVAECTATLAIISITGFLNRNHQSQTGVTHYFSC